MNETQHSAPGGGEGAAQAARPPRPPRKRAKRLDGRPILRIKQLAARIRAATHLNAQVALIAARCAIDEISEHVLCKGGLVHFRGFEILPMLEPSRWHRNPEVLHAALHGLPWKHLPGSVEYGPWIKPALHLGRPIAHRLKVARLRGLSFAPGGTNAPKPDELPRCVRTDRVHR